MREIRFRAWDNIKKEMFQVVKLDLKNKTVWDRGLGYIINNPNQDIKLLQFTGLKDVNGKDIYEGDILENRLGTGLIEWKDNGFWMKLIKCENEEDKQFHWDFSMEEPNKVIGNIYINGDLLK